MSKPVIKPFVFNDETVANTYGFFISTEGIDLTRFSKNPVMLSDHWNNNNYVLGKWTDWKKEGALLTGLPEFDIEDENAAKISGKVERGYLNGCSMGILLDRENLTYVDGKIFLTKCELAEVSIVPVPSNANAVRLYNPAGELMKEEDIKNLCLSITENPNQEKPTNENLNTDDKMKKIILSLAAFVALGYDTKAFPKEGIEESELDSKILDLSAKLTAAQSENSQLKTANQTMVDAQKAQALTAATTMVELAIKEGRIGADKKDSFIELAKSNPELAKATLESIPAKQNFSAGVTVPSGTGAEVEVKSAEDFQKLSLTEQLAFKDSNPEGYANLFK